METLAVVSVVYIFLATVLETQGQVISGPDNVTVCERRSTTFTCVLDRNYRNISSGDIQWHRIIGTNTAEPVGQQGSNINFTTSTTNNTLTTTLTITTTIKSYAGLYFVGTPHYSVCHASLTVTTSPPGLTVNITKNTESSSIVVHWNLVDDSLSTTYTVTWNTEKDMLDSVSLEEQSSYTIPGLTLDTVYFITVIAQNSCGSGPEYSASVSLTTDTTSSSTSTITAITNTMAIMSAASSSASTAIIKSSTITITASIAVSKTSSANPSPFITSTNTATDIISPVSTTNSTDTSTTDASTANENSNSSVYIIVGVIIGVILVLSLLFIIMICYFMRKKGKNKKNEYSDLTGNGTLDKNMQMVPNSLSTNGQDEKPAELEAEPSYDTVEVHYMMPNMGSANTNSKQCDVLEKSPSKEKLDGENHQPIEYAVVDKSKKVKKKDNQKKADDPQKDTDDVPHSDVPVVTVPRGDDQTSDGVNQNTNNPTIHYAELERLPKATGNYLAKDDSSKQYALVV